MKRNFSITAIVVALAIVVTVGLCETQSQPKMSDSALENVEALASGESEFCENGCYDNGSGCFCEYWFPTYREASN